MHLMQTYVKRQLCIASCLYLGQTLVGFALGWTAPVIPKLQDPEQSPLPDAITETEASLIGSLLYIGAVAGPYISGFLSNFIGRKPCLLLGGSIAIIAFMILALANDLAMIFAGRILTGLGTGVIFATNLVYIGEIASTNIRGILLTMTAIFTTVGTLLVYSIGPYFPYSVTGYVATGLTTIFCIGTLFIPESPLYFVMKGNENAAKQVLHDLARFDEMDKVMLFKDTEDKISVREEWTQFFTVKSNRKALTITLTLHILQLLSGVPALILFATTIFDIAESSIDPNIATIIIGVTQVSAASMTLFFVERNGRKILLLISSAFCCFSLVVLGIYFYLDDIDHSSASKLQWLPLVTLILFFISFNIGLGVIPGTYLGEMFESNVRSTGAAVTISMGLLVGFGVATVFGYMMTALGGHITFWIFAGMNAIAFFFTLIYVPETKGKTLLEIQEMLSK